MTPRFVVAAVLVAAIAGGAVAQLDPRRETAAPLDVLHEELMRVEDARGDTSVLERALRSSDTSLRRRAVRALGRFERPELVERLRPLLADASPLVRIEASQAVAQAVYQGRVGEAFAALRDRIDSEREPSVLAALAAAVGRLRYETAEEIAAAEGAVLTAWSSGLEASAADATAMASVHLGVARGLESLSRRSRVRSLGPAARRVLEGMLTSPLAASATTADPVRRAAVAAAAGLVAASAFGPSAVTAALDSEDPELRRWAALWTARENVADAVVVDRLRRDASPLVRVELARAINRASAPACELATVLMSDAHVNVQLTAIDAAARACTLSPSSPGVDTTAAPSTTTTTTAATTTAPAPLPDAGPATRHVASAAVAARASWQLRAHALATWAALDPQAARGALASAGAAPTWQERLYAARTAGALRAVDVLERLVGDANANVRDVALTALAASDSALAARAALDALKAEDYQLVRTAATLLAKSPVDDEIVAALLESFSRISREARDTARDPRRAILEALRALGPSDAGPRALASDTRASQVHRDELIETLRPVLRDADSVIATLAAEVLTRWTGQPVVASPSRRSARKLPSMSDLRRWATTTAVMRLAGLGELEFRLLAFEAPTNVARFVEQVRAGFFDGLTWHRVEPNFVLQGGSPGANEYSAAGPYTNDEITSASHLRGTIGISTRGRDTGDGQVFVNLADNLRLDHNFTIVGEIVRGVELVDLVVEGTVIERVTLRESGELSGAALDASAARLRQLSLGRP